MKSDQYIMLSDGIFVISIGSASMFDSFATSFRCNRAGIVFEVGSTKAPIQVANHPKKKKKLYRNASYCWN
jgi:hypothetical protein